MELDELTIELISDGMFWHKGKTDFICATLLRDYFEIPKKAKKLYVRLSRKSAKDRFKIDDIFKWGDWWYVYFEDKSECICWAAYEKLKEFGVPCYVEFWWE